MQQHPVIAMPLKEDGVQRFNSLGGILMHSCANRIAAIARLAADSISWNGAGPDLGVRSFLYGC